MQVNVRHENRRANSRTYSITWETAAGLTRSAEVAGIDLAPSGLCFRWTEELPEGTSIFIQAPDGRPTGYAKVRHSTRRAAGFAIGVEFTEETKKSVSLPPEQSTDYYEFLQISPKAEPATIHRVYRFLASRFHPDNPETGDPEKFVLLNRAYAVLSDPQQRADYDSTREVHRSQPIPVFESSEFVNGIEGEVNRRLGVLYLLYTKRRTNPDNPRVSLMDLERWMAFPREYLDFATWYLRNKKYITMEDNSDFALTALGVDYVEANAGKNPILRKLLNAGSPTVTGNDPGSESTAERLADELFRLPPAEDDSLRAPAGPAGKDLK